MAWTTATTRATNFEVTAAVWNSEHVDNMNFLKEVNYTEYTSGVNITATAVGSANQIVTSGAITYENVPHLIEFYCPRVTSSTGNCWVILRDSTTVLGVMARYPGSDNPGECKATRRLTPTAASHSYNVAGWLSASGTWVFNAGTGGAAGGDTENFPGYIRITRIPT